DEFGRRVAHGVDAGERDRVKTRQVAKIAGSKRDNPGERQQDGRKAVLDEPPRSLVGARLGTGHEDAPRHDQLSKKRGPAFSRMRKPASRPSAAASDALPSAAISWTSRPSGVRIMPEKRKCSPSMMA